MTSINGRPRLSSHSVMLVKAYEGEALPDPDAIEGGICLGCPHSAARYHEHVYLKALFAWLARVVREDRPYLGICFGGQLLARVLGAPVEEGNAREIGTYMAKLTEAGAADPLFAGFPREFAMFHWHNDTFRTPFGGVHLAEDEVWAHQAFRRNRQVGLQFHLEPRACDVVRWCEAYPDELAVLGKTKEEVVAEFEGAYETIRGTNFRLLDNWLG
ncbi:MAG TPA: type 1 glutamine amidotransferase [candidate division Zixibacteria bacterium]|nr:type 1 glutamine amidotransferase [candidate division Zixibacteria bacterium]